MKSVININAVKASVDGFFSILEAVKPTKEYWQKAKEAGIKNPVSKRACRFDTKEKNKLVEIFEIRKKQYSSKMKKRNRSTAVSSSAKGFFKLRLLSEVVILFTRPATV